MKARGFIDRLDAAFERAESLGGPPTAIRLTPADRKRFDALKSAEWGGPVHCFSHRNVQIFKGERSVVESGAYSVPVAE